VAWRRDAADAAALMPGSADADEARGDEVVVDVPPRGEVVAGVVDVKDDTKMCLKLVTIALTT
jgi:hypothetical protein